MSNISDAMFEGRLPKGGLQKTGGFLNPEKLVGF